MRHPRDFQTDRCYHLISRVAHRAFYLAEVERTRSPRSSCRWPEASGRSSHGTGGSSPNYFTSRYLTPLAAAGLIASEGVPHSPQRTYRLTANSRRVLT